MKIIIIACLSSCQGDREQTHFSVCGYITQEHPITKDIYAIIIIIKPNYNDIFRKKVAFTTYAVSTKRTTGQKNKKRRIWWCRLDGLSCGWILWKSNRVMFSDDHFFVSIFFEKIGVVCSGLVWSMLERWVCVILSFDELVICHDHDHQKRRGNKRWVFWKDGENDNRLMAECGDGFRKICCRLSDHA